MNLLVTQLRNQDPLEPLDNNQMASQLAMFSQLEQLENISTTFQKVLVSQQMNEASGMIGKEVTYQPKDSDTERRARVEGVQVVDGEVRLAVGGGNVGLEEIRSVRN
jgi:flagellar basal-body rod modification protein FlgD